MRSWSGCSADSIGQANAACPACVMEKESVIHPFAPVWDENCRILVLGTFPSVKSRENAFYYGHPQNRFWRMLGMVYGAEPPNTIEEKRGFLLLRRIALWDVIRECDIAGSSDSSIRGAVPNDLPALLEKCPISRVLLNGKTAEKIYLKYWKELPITHIALPSTSPANAACSMEKLVREWGNALKGENV